MHLAGTESRAVSQSVGNDFAMMRWEVAWWRRRAVGVGRIVAGSGFWSATILPSWLAVVRYSANLPRALAESLLSGMRLPATRLCCALCYRMRHAVHLMLLSLTDALGRAVSDA